MCILAFCQLAATYVAKWFEVASDSTITICGSPSPSFCILPICHRVQGTSARQGSVRLSRPTGSLEEADQTRDEVHFRKYKLPACIRSEHKLAARAYGWSDRFQYNSVSLERLTYERTWQLEYSVSHSPSVTTSLSLLRAGDPAAAEAVWQRYYAQMVELARQHLARRVRQGADEEDVAQIAFAEFCAGAAAGRYPRLSSRHDLWTLLLTITLRRARDLADHEGRQRRDRGRTAGADLLGLPDADLDRLAGDAPDPALAAEIADHVRFLFSHLPGDDLRIVARELLAGYTAPEAARRLGCSLRTIERRWQRIRQFWEPLTDR